MSTSNFPVPRPRPIQGGLATPHRELRDGAWRLYKQFEQAERALRGGIQEQATRAQAEPLPLPDAIWDVQLYARAIHVFALMTIEAALNTYGLMRFGEEQFEKHFAFHGPTKRLQRLVKYGVDRDIAVAR